MSNRIEKLLNLLEAREELNQIIQHSLNEVDLPQWSKSLGNKILPNYGRQSTAKPTDEEVQKYKQEVARRKQQMQQQKSSVVSKIAQNYKMRNELLNQ